MQVRTPTELLALRLRTMLWVEEALAGEILPRLYDLVHSVDLRYGIERHEIETQQHVRIVRGVLHLLGGGAEPLESPALLGLKAEHDALMEQVDESRHDVADLARAEVLTQCEHLEIAAYTGLRSLAAALGEGDVALRLQEVLEQEQYALELAEKALAKLRAEQIENARRA